MWLVGMCPEEKKQKMVVIPQQASLNWYCNLKCDHCKGPLQATTRWTQMISVPSLSVWLFVLTNRHIRPQFPTVCNTHIHRKDPSATTPVLMKPCPCSPDPCAACLPGCSLLQAAERPLQKPPRQSPGYCDGGAAARSSSRLQHCCACDAGG